MAKWGTTTAQLLSFLCWEHTCCHCFNCIFEVSNLRTTKTIIKPGPAELAIYWKLTFKNVSFENILLQLGWVRVACSIWKIIWSNGLIFTSSHIFLFSSSYFQKFLCPTWNKWMFCGLNYLNHGLITNICAHYPFFTSLLVVKYSLY